MFVPFHVNQKYLRTQWATLSWWTQTFNLLFTTNEHWYFVLLKLKLQALNNLGSVYVDCGKLELAADCYISALKIRHTRAHQGLARVHFLKNERNAAYEEMTKLIEKARNNASAYEKRSEYCDRDLSKEDLQMVTQLDPLRVYPYRYRAAGMTLLWAFAFFCTLMSLLFSTGYLNKEIKQMSRYEYLSLFLFDNKNYLNVLGYIWHPSVLDFSVDG